MAHILPKQNLEQLEVYLPKVHQGKIALQECSKLPAMHVELLEAALDPEMCNRAVNKALEDLKISLQVLH